MSTGCSGEPIPRRQAWAGLDDRQRVILSKLNALSRVLDVGCVQGDREWEKVSWLHRYICEAVRETIGLDIDLNGSVELARSGYKVIAGDAQELPFREGSFDALVAGDVIEHLSNPGRFLDGAHQVLRGEGRLILSTVNVWCFFHFLFEFLVRRSPNIEHVSWYDLHTLTALLERHGFRIREVCYHKFPRGSGFAIGHVIYVLGIRFPADILWRFRLIRRFVSPGIVAVCAKVP